MLSAVQTSPPGASAAREPSEDLGRKRKLFRAFETGKKDEIKEAREARQYYHDKQWTDEERRKLARRGQQATTRNKIKRKIDFLVGIEQRLRRDPRAYPRTPVHEHDADTATAGLRFVCSTYGWTTVSSEGMHGGLVSGIGVAFIGIGPDGKDPSLKDVDVDRFFYDPRSVKSDFSDARYMGMHLWLDIDEAIEKWPDQADKLMKMMESSSSGMTTSAVEEDRSEQWSDLEHRRVRVIELWELARTDSLMQSSSLTPASSKPMFGWKFCFFTGDVVLESGWSPYVGLEGEPDNPYEAWSPYIDEKGNRYGLVRTMKSIQDEINHASSKLLHRMTTRQFFFKEGAVADVDEFAREIAKPDGKLKIAEHAEWGRDVGPVDDGARMQGEVERYQMSVMDMENYGPNPGLVGQGQGVDGASGRALLAQRDSGMTELSPVFERHRDWKLRCYRKMWARIRQAWTAERWIRVTDDKDAVQFVQLNAYQMDPMSGQIVSSNVLAQIDVDVMLDEGPDTITMNEELLQTLSQLSSVPPPMWKVFIELSNTPQKDKLFKMLDEAQQEMQPPPDPMVELKAQEIQQRGQEMQIKGEQEQQKALIDREKAETDLQIANANLMLKRLDIEQKQIEFQGNRELKMIEIEAQERQAIRDEEAQRTQMDHDAARTSAEMDRIRLEREIKAEEAQRKAETIEKDKSSDKKAATSDDIAKLVKALTAPKRVVRDPKTNRAIGVESIISGDE